MHVITKRDISNALRAARMVIFVLLIMSRSVAYAETTSASDFTADVQKGLNTIAQKDVGVATAIKTQDYKSSWDEFGSNVIVDGTNTPADVQKNLTDDIVKDIGVQLAYNQRDEQYLQLRHSSPEEVLALEGDGSGDLLPQNYIEPNPSLDANPAANPSALDMPVDKVDTSSTNGDTSNTTGPASSASVTPDTTTAPPSPDVVKPPNTLAPPGTVTTPPGGVILPDTVAPTDTPILPDSLVPPESAWKPSDINVFETILDAGVASTPASPLPSPDANASPAPSADTTAADAAVEVPAAPDIPPSDASAPDAAASPAPASAAPSN